MIVYVFRQLCVYKLIVESLFTALFLKTLFLCLVATIVFAFANSVDQDQDRKNVGPGVGLDLDPDSLILHGSVPEIFF